MPRHNRGDEGGPERIKRPKLDLDDFDDGGGKERRGREQEYDREENLRSFTGRWDRNKEEAAEETPIITETQTTNTWPKVPAVEPAPVVENLSAAESRKETKPQPPTVEEVLTETKTQKADARPKAPADFNSNGKKKKGPAPKLSPDDYSEARETFGAESGGPGQERARTAAVNRWERGNGELDVMAKTWQWAEADRQKGNKGERGGGKKEEGKPAVTGEATEKKGEKSNGLSIFVHKILIRLFPKYIPLELDSLTSKEFYSGLHPQDQKDLGYMLSVVLDQAQKAREEAKGQGLQEVNVMGLRGVQEALFRFGLTSEGLDQYLLSQGGQTSEKAVGEQGNVYKILEKYVKFLDKRKAGKKLNRDDHQAKEDFKNLPPEAVVSLQPEFREEWESLNHKKLSGPVPPRRNPLEVFPEPARSESEAAPAATESAEPLPTLADFGEGEGENLLEQMQAAASAPAVEAKNEEAGMESIIKAKEAVLAAIKKTTEPGSIERLCQSIINILAQEEAARDAKGLDYSDLDEIEREILAARDARLAELGAPPAEAAPATINEAVERAVAETVELTQTEIDALPEILSFKGEAEIGEEEVLEPIPEAELLLERARTTSEEMELLLAGFDIETSPEERTEAREEAKEQFANLPEEGKKRVAIGLKNLGLFVKGKKSQYLADALNWSGRKLKKDSTTAKFLEALASTYQVEADDSQRKIEEINELTQAHKDTQFWRHKFSNYAYVPAALLKTGRITADVLGLSIAAPMRYAMMATMGLARGAEAYKRYRLAEVNKEGWENYKQQENIEAGVNFWQYLDKTIGDNIRIRCLIDIKSRLEQAPTDETPATIFQRIARADLRRAIVKIDKKVRAIERRNISEEDKAIEINLLLRSYGKFLQEVNLMVYDLGTVDTLALGAQYMETAAKAAVSALTIQTLINSAHYLLEKTPEYFHYFERAGNPAIPLEASTIQPAAEAIHQSSVAEVSGAPAVSPDLAQASSPELPAEAAPILPTAEIPAAEAPAIPGPEKLQQFLETHHLLQTTGAEINQDGGGIKVIYEIGRGKDFTSLDQALRRVVMQEFNAGPDNIFGAVEAAQAENALANLRMILEGHTVADVTPDELARVAGFHDGQLEIKDYDGFKGVVDRLLGHAHGRITQESEAMDYINKTSIKNWQKMLEQKAQAETAQVDFQNMNVDAAPEPTVGPATAAPTVAAAPAEPAVAATPVAPEAAAAPESPLSPETNLTEVKVGEHDLSPLLADVLPPAAAGEAPYEVRLENIGGALDVKLVIGDTEVMRNIEVAVDNQPHQLAEYLPDLKKEVGSLTGHIDRLAGQLGTDREETIKFLNFVDAVYHGDGRATFFDPQKPGKELGLLVKVFKGETNLLENRNQQAIFDFVRGKMDLSQAKNILKTTQALDFKLNNSGDNAFLEALAASGVKFKFAAGKINIDNLAGQRVLIDASAEPHQITVGKRLFGGGIGNPLKFNLNIGRLIRVLKL